MRTIAVALLLVLAGCGGGSEEPPATTKTSASPAKASKATTTPTPSVAAPKGAPAPEALSRFHCAKDAKGVWSTSGYVANDGKSKATFQVTVYVGEAAGGSEKAKTRQVPNVAAGGSAKFAITKLPAPQDGGVCHVQVLVQH